MIDREQIGIRISALRKRAGLSQSALAEKLGISPQAVSKWESGRNLPDIGLFRELAWLFDMTIDNIVNDDLTFVQKTGLNRFLQALRRLLLALREGSFYKACPLIVLTGNYAA